MKNDLGRLYRKFLDEKKHLSLVLQDAFRLSGKIKIIAFLHFLLLALYRPLRSRMKHGLLRPGCEILAF